MAFFQRGGVWYVDYNAMGERSKGKEIDDHAENYELRKQGVPALHRMGEGPWPAFPRLRCADPRMQGLPWRYPS
jgi:hypothetical protein